VVANVENLQKCADMTQTGSGTADYTFTGMASGVLGGSLSFLLVNRVLVGWLLTRRDLWAQLPWLSWVFWPENFLPVALWLMVGAAAGTVTGILELRSVRAAFFTGLGLGFAMTSCISPIPFERD
jgi:hypothetical protein